MSVVYFKGIAVHCILGDIYKLMLEPTNEKDVNAVAVVRPKPDKVQTERAVDPHPNILHKEFEVTGLAC